MAPSARVTVIVVTWNGRAHLGPCLDALSRQTLTDFDVILVDNGSTDGSAEFVSQHFPSVRVIRNARNLGFAAANNIGIRASDTPYVATLNNDTIAESTWLEALVRVAESRPELGSVASKMVFAHDPTTINSCGIAIDPAAIAWDLWGGYPAAAVDQPRTVFGPCAGAALYRRAMLDEVGLFDEDFFAYLEDVDLAWRARLRGWDSVLAPDAIVHHAHAGTLGEGSPTKRFLLARNKVWTIAKCAPFAQLLRWLPLMLIYDAGAASFGVIHGRDWASVRGRLAGLRGIGRALDKRRAIQARRSVSWARLRPLFAPLAPPWDVPRRYRHLVAPPRSVGPPDHRGRPAALRDRMRQPLLDAAGLALRSSGKRASQGEPRVVVLRPDHLGDVLLSRPALQLLRDSLPPNAVTTVVGPWSAAALEGTALRVVTFAFPAFTRAPKPNALAPYATLLALATRLRAERFDAALVLRPDHWWGALAVALAGIPVRVGHRTPGTAPFLTHAVSDGDGEHAADTAHRAALALLAALGREASACPDRHVTVTYAPRPASARAADAWLAREAIDADRFIVVHPGAGADVKLWPAKRWAALFAALPDPAIVGLTAGPGEETLREQVRLQCPRQLHVAPRLDWDGLAALYARARLVIGVDSGPLHLAAAVGTPTVRLYGPTDPRWYGPRGQGTAHEAIRSELPCAPCGDLDHPPCGFRFDAPCMASISVEAVARAADALFRLRASASGPFR